MATVTQVPAFNHEETQRRVKHPLQLVRSYIRRYIVLEGIALTLLCASAVFWVGLALDYGLFQLEIPALNLFGIDWLLEFNEIDTSGLSGIGTRVVILTIIVVGLAALGITKVVLRWLREFNDRAIALVLERKFPKELGDRLITSVELADPRLSKKYGYSQAMVEKTILEAVAAIDKLPVAEVFNWRRLVGLWGFVAASTIGMMVLTMAAFCGGSLLADKPTSPIAFSWKFYDAASIWTERNILMMNSYWPRRAYLEVGRFQPSKKDATDMRVARDDDRPELQVQAIEWVIADRKAPHGWRALRWKDLYAQHLVDKGVLDRLDIPTDFKYWQLDTDELEPNLVAALFGGDVTGKSSGEIRAHLAQPAIQAKIKERDAQTTLDAWLDWKEWSVDKLSLQRENIEARDHAVVRAALGSSLACLWASSIDGQLNAAAAAALIPTRTGQTVDAAPLADVFAELEDIVERPRMSRTVRKLEVPGFVDVTFRGRESGGVSNEARKRQEGNKYSVPLKSLRDATHFSFRARGENYFTPPKVITLVPAPTPAGIAIDKEEPAYIHHHLVGPNQMPLRGMKHQTKALALSTTGDTNTIEMPIGSKLVIHVRMPKSEGTKRDDVDRPDRKLRAERPVFAKEPPTIDPAFDLFKGEIKLDDDHYGFTLAMDSVTRNHDFVVEFFDEDNIRGKRRFKVLRTLDGEPHVGNLSVFGYQPRTPRFKAPTSPADLDNKEKDKEVREPSRDQSELTKAYLITPDALLQFECKVADDYGLVKVGYHYKYRKVDFELVSGGGAKKLPTLQIDQAKRLYHAELIVGNFQMLPWSPLALHAAPNFIGFTANEVDRDIKIAQRYKEGTIASIGFDELLQRRRKDMIDFDDHGKLDLTKRKGGGWEFDLKEDPGFDLRLYAPELKAKPLDEIGQMHYHLQIAVQATDNNVESGAEYPLEIEVKDANGTVTKKTIIVRGNTKRNGNGYLNFIVVSENELLAQIALDEELLNEKLEGAKEKVDSSMVSLLDQQNKIRTTTAERMEDILTRMNTIRTELGSVGNVLREAHSTYDNIKREMEFNRVDKSRIKKIDETIIARIEQIVSQDTRFLGSFPRADDAFQRALQLVEDETNAKKNPDLEAHQRLMFDAHRQMDALSKDLKGLLDAMSEGIVESKLIALIDGIERRQRDHSRILHNWKVERELELLRDLLNPPDKKDDKKPEKKDEKKTSQLQQAPAETLGGVLAPRVQLESSGESIWMIARQYYPAIEAAPDFNL